MQVPSIAGLTGSISHIVPQPQTAFPLTHNTVVRENALPFAEALGADQVAISQDKRVEGGGQVEQRLESMILKQLLGELMQEMEGSFFGDSPHSELISDWFVESIASELAQKSSLGWLPSSDENSLTE